MKLWILLSIFMLVQADLLDLYVQHMDETMGTNSVQKNYRKRMPLRFRNKRSPKVNTPIEHSKKQQINVDDGWWDNKTPKKQSKKPILTSDGLNFPNMNEQNYNPLHHEYIKDNKALEFVEGFDISYKNRNEEVRAERLIENESEEVVTKEPLKLKAKKYYDNMKATRKSMKQGESETDHFKFKRSVKEVNFTRHEMLDDNGLVFFEWDPSDDDIVTFRVTARTLGYIGIGFNDKVHMRGADILLGWVDDHSGTVNLLDSHGDEETNASPITDLSQDVDILEGFQNNTHTSITFSRRWQTCDPDDRHLTEDNVRVLWAMHEADPELNTPIWHGEKRGGRALRLRAPAPVPSPPRSPDIRHWDVKLNQFTVDDKQETIYWCKIFTAPALEKKHHMIGYEPLVEKGNEGLVHHMILYECTSTSQQLGQYSRVVGGPCHSSTTPPEWDSCIQPVVAWARGSKGEWLPDHVGIPVAEHKEGSYYMLEVHYNNPSKRTAIDSSGVRLHLTPILRPQEAGIFVTGVAVSPLHFIPPEQKQYATAGYCNTQCTEKLFPEDGVNVVSVVLHSHMAGRRMSLKHIREGNELPHIVKENHFDFNYQQSHSVKEEVKILPGDELITECVYGTQDRKKPTLGGYSAMQEMCLAFVVYYPRTELASCYSITPAKDLFKTLGVHNFKGVTLDNLERMFSSTGTDAVSSPTTATRSNEGIYKEVIKGAETAVKAMKEYSDERNEDNVFTRLVIENPPEFRGRTLADHLLALPWAEDLLTRQIENSLYHGKHTLFCIKRNDQLALPIDTKLLPNFTKLPEKNETVCRERMIRSSSVMLIPNLFILCFIIAINLLNC
ncbi:MOXD1 homolog 1 [Chelonus insularis]|uniref:MOXD1 homolog 1 n=1 Tax=Chelonus insularis TaxID=460826 RepID=UPI00158CE259|nr:MOXD1 homolog 1 [Chelonus insularis]